MTHLKSIKPILFFISILMAFAACKSNEKSETRDIQLLTDSSVYHNSPSSDTSRMTETSVTPPKGKVQNNHVNPSGTHHSGSTSTNSGNTSTGNSGSSGTTSNSGTTTTSSAPKKKGWSKAAQGAVIGGAAGAVGGAIISKKKGTGAAIGAVVGAAGGYIIGRGKDKKDGRVK